MKTNDDRNKARLFNNIVLEFFTKTNPVVHVLAYGSWITIFVCINHTPFKSNWWLPLAGFFFWTLFEYLMHRFLFHISFKKIQYLIHGVHHQYPRDRERLLMPPLPGSIIIFLLYLISLWCMGSVACLFMSGFVSGYMAYTVIHYIIHTRKPVKGFKFLWTHHLKHHNPHYSHKAFGVSSPLWDYIFGTNV